jgi:tungstate transport system substrate-binding protein
MGPALNMAAAPGRLRAGRPRHVAGLSSNRGALKVLVEGDRSLFNPYGVMVVNPARHPHVKHALAQAFADWLVSPAGQAAIGGYRIGGEPLFFPNAGR